MAKLATKAAAKRMTAKIMKYIKNTKPKAEPVPTMILAEQFQWAVSEYMLAKHRGDQFRGLADQLRTRFAHVQEAVYIPLAGLNRVVVLGPNVRGNMSDTPMRSVYLATLAGDVK